MKRLSLIDIAGYRIRFIFAWYDLWVGLFYDQEKKRLYFFPLPTLGFSINKIYPHP